MAIAPHRSGLCAYVSTGLLISLALGPFVAPAAAQTRLVGYARLPADTFREGPPATNAVKWCWRTPPARWDRQPVQGISSLRPGPDNTYWALSDNGFGARINSSTYILCIYRLRIDWRTATGGTGTVEVLETVELKDPQHKAGFAIKRDWDRERRLTGADFDPESLEIGPGGNFWISDEFGPWLLPFTREGVLLDSPIPATIEHKGKSRLVKSPEQAGWRTNLDRSRGFEGLCLHPGEKKFYLLLEGNLRREPADQLRLFEYLPGLPTVQSTNRRYRLERAGHSIGELSWWPQRDCFLIVERDWGHGPTANFKRVFAWQPQIGDAVKWEVADLMNIQDPQQLADSTGIFTMPYVTIESVYPVDERTLLVCNDNNFPAKGGRTSLDRDATEFVLLQVDLESGQR